MLLTAASFVSETSLLLGRVLYHCSLSVLRTLIPFEHQKSLKGEIVLITGGGSGIGRLQALEYAKLGSIVVIWDINDKGLISVADEIRNIGGIVYTYVCDISKKENIFTVAECVRQDVGHVTILVNNAGIVTGKKFLNCSDDMIVKTFDINTMAHLWTVKAFLPSMLEHDHGHIVTISSCAGTIGTSGLCDYSASKFAVVGFDEALRFELHSMGKTGVHTTCVCPFYINTGMFDGVRTRFSFLLPILEPEYVVSRIMRAVRTNQPFLMVPRFTYIGYLCRFLLPTKVFDYTSHYLGITSSMDKFKGRQK